MTQPNITALPSAVAPPPPHHGPVLVVDPDAALRRVLRLVIEGAGYGCITCSNADDAAQLTADHRPTLVIIEAQLRDAESGFARRIAGAASRPTRVALMSAYPRPPRGDEDFFIPKPIAFDRLLHLLELVERELKG